MSNSVLFGTNKVTEAEVIAVPDAQFTATFKPYAHREIISAVKQSATAIGLEIVKSEYVLAQNGQQMFGVYDLSQGTSELSWSIGIRNSMNKSLSIGITAGTRVFVCDNLCFSGEFLAFRRHTSALDIDELAFLAYRSMKQMIPLLRSFQFWQQGLKNIPLTATDSKLLLVEIMTNNVIPPSKFSQFNDLYANVYDDSMWGFHEAATDILRGSNLLSMPKKNKVLNQIINSYIHPLESVGRSALGEFYENRALQHR